MGACILEQRSQLVWVCHGTPNELQWCTGVLKTLKPSVQSGRSPCCEKSVYPSVQDKYYRFFSVCHAVERGWEALQENLLEYRVTLLKNWDFSHGIYLCTEIWTRYKVSMIYFLHHSPHFNIIEEEPLKNASSLQNPWSRGPWSDKAHVCGSLGIQATQTCSRSYQIKMNFIKWMESSWHHWQI